MYLVIDNYDSFVHNLARYFEIAGAQTHITRNDALTINDIQTLTPTAIIISPGPCTPTEAGMSIEAVKKFGATIPILGICLGHQAIGEAYGATTTRAPAPMHGKASTITHDQTNIFKSIPSPLKVGRYHSLIVTPQKTTPLITTAQTDTGEIMALKHSTHPVYGLQFHPESILTEHGQAIINNFVEIVENRK